MSNFFKAFKSVAWGRIKIEVGFTTSSVPVITFVLMSQLLRKVTFANEEIRHIHKRRGSKRFMVEHVFSKL